MADPPPLMDRDPKFFTYGHTHNIIWSLAPSILTALISTTSSMLPFFRKICHLIELLFLLAIDRYIP